jgi:hypothetical protein
MIASVVFNDDHTELSCLCCTLAFVNYPFVIQEANVLFPVFQSGR